MSADGMSVRVEVLGPLRLVVDGTPIDVPGPKRRAVLALLALAEGKTVTVDYLLYALWPSEVPESGRQALHTHVSRLRAHLGSAANRLQTWHDGYRFDLGIDELDVAQARALLARARAVGERDPTAAFALLREAHELWRGPVLADLAYADFALAEAGRLEELRLVCLEERIAAELALGRRLEDEIAQQRGSWDPRGYESAVAVVAEAFAHGRPVVATALGGLAELVDEQVERRSRRHRCRQDRRIGGVEAGVQEGSA
jgi:DNA-binding SARP family transcriptional activator